MLVELQQQPLPLGFAGSQFDGLVGVENFVVVNCFLKYQNGYEEDKDRFPKSSSR